MSLDTARVIWSEGLFLRPHHFQQLERHFESLLDGRLSHAATAQFGFLNLQIDRAMLLQGKLHLATAVGLFPDRTPFEVAGAACRLRPFDVPEGTRDQIVCLSAVLRRHGVKTVALDETEVPHGSGVGSENSKGNRSAAARTRYTAVDAKVADNIVGFDGEAELKVAALNLSIGLLDGLDGALTSLPIARVVERRADGSVLLDETFLPPLLDIAAHPRTRSWLDELHGLIHQRADALAGRMGSAATSGVGDTTDFLLLLACNRCEPLLAQLRQTTPLHPMQLFHELVKLAGECATFSRESRRPPELPVYKHLALADCFEPVVEEIRRAMTAVLDQTAVRIPLRDVGNGLFRADVPDPRLITTAFFVLAAASQWPAERLRSAIPAQVKIGPTDKLRDLVMLNLPGIKLDALQYPPRQIPFHANFCYFQLDASDPLWAPIEISRAMGLYVAGEPPALEMQLWAIRT